MQLDSIDVEYFLRVHEQIGNIGDTDISVSCPMCREGRSWGRKHRLHLYIKPSYDSASIRCWNCNYSSNMFGYLSEIHPLEFSSYKKAKSGKGFAELKMDSQKKDKIIDTSNIDIGINFNLDSDNTEELDDERPVDAKDIISIDIGMDFLSPSEPSKPVRTNTPKLIKPLDRLVGLPDEVKEYIKSRGLPIQETWLYSPKNNKIRFNNTDIILSEYIIIPLVLNDKWYGFQALAWKQKKFFVYLVTGNTSWKVENWNNIDKDEDVFIMESIYDRLSTGIKNSIAVLGSNLNEDRLKELKKPIFCLDNQNIDEKAKEETLSYLESGYRCFIWPKETPNKIKDFNDLRKIGVSYEKIEKMIKNNIHQGISGVVRIKML